VGKIDIDEYPIVESAANITRVGDVMGWFAASLKLYPKIARRWNGFSGKPGLHPFKSVAIGLSILSGRMVFAPGRRCPMHYISEVLGHHSIDFTRKHYARFSPDSPSKNVLRVLEGRKMRLG